MRNLKIGVAAAMLVVLAGVMDSPAKDKEGGDRAITRPSADRILSFTRPGTIAQVAIEEIRTAVDPKTNQNVEKIEPVQPKLVVWDKVKKGQILVRLDTRVEMIQLAQLKAQAEDDIRVQAQKAQLDQRRVDLKKVKEAYDKEVATLLELEHAKLDVTIGELSVQLAVFEKDQARLKYEQLRQDITHMRLASPINGCVAEILKNVGEAVDKSVDVLRVVQLDPLWIDVSVDRSVADRFARDDTAKVVFPSGEAAVGKIVHIAGMEDAASSTAVMRLEVPNPTGRRAGQTVTVFFPPAKPAAKAPE